MQRAMARPADRPSEHFCTNRALTQLRVLSQMATGTRFLAKWIKSLNGANSVTHCTQDRRWTDHA
eukprot:11108456-Heterocapsa_arctica.AAC.1